MALCIPVGTTAESLVNAFATNDALMMYLGAVYNERKAMEPGDSYFMAPYALVLHLAGATP